MELFVTAENLKSLITFMHLSGLALGLGGAWILDIYFMTHMKAKLTSEKNNFIEFIAKLVIVGLVFLWVSGIGFLLFYYLFTPEYLLNQKIWAKLFIVTVLTINGFLVHKVLLRFVKNSVGRCLVYSLQEKELRLAVCIATLSFISWLFPIILGVTESLNFTTSANNIITVYLVCLCIGILIGNVMVNPYVKTAFYKFN